MAETPVSKTDGGPVGLVQIKTVTLLGPLRPGIGIATNRANGTSYRVEPRTVSKQKAWWNSQ